MTHVQLVEEVSYYIRKISVLEDWFRYLCGRKEIRQAWQFREKLEMMRPDPMPLISQIRVLSKEELLALAGPLSDYAYELDQIRFELYNKGVPKNKLRRFWISIYMYDFERGRYPHWVAPFTREERVKYLLFKTDPLRLNQ